MACVICDVDLALARDSRSRVVMALSGCYAWRKFYAVLLRTLCIIRGIARMYAPNWVVLLYGRIYRTNISSAYGLCYL